MPKTESSISASSIAQRTVETISTLAERWHHIKDQPEELQNDFNKGRATGYAQAIQLLLGVVEYAKIVAALEDGTL